MCEVQLHTLASELWSATGHDLAYKATVSLPDDIRRTVNRLSALTEIYDAELMRVRENIEQDPRFPAARLVPDVESVFYSVTGTPSPDHELSTAAIGALMPALDEETLRNYRRVLTTFAQAHERRLAFIYREHDPSAYQMPMLAQPAAIMVFERLAQHEPALRAACRKCCPSRGSTI